MKVIVLSDLHGVLPVINDDFDLMLICGDICPTPRIYGLKYFQEDWLKDHFKKWVDKLHYRDNDSKVVFIAGNHDFVFDDIKDETLNDILKTLGDRVVYLCNEKYEFTYKDKTYSIFGTPYCKLFSNWAFMPKTEDELDEKYKKIPEGLDFLISHDAADINNLGLINMGEYKGLNAGNVLLAKYVNKTKPKYYLCGHIHSGTHKLTKIGETYMANVAYLNENYEPSHKPLKIKIDE